MNRFMFHVPHRMRPTAACQKAELPFGALSTGYQHSASPVIDRTQSSSTKELLSGNDLQFASEIGHRNSDFPIKHGDLPQLFY